MIFNDEHKVKIETMNKEEAKAFIIFLDTEIIRHLDDIKQAKTLKETVKKLFGLE